MFSTPLGSPAFSSSFAILMAVSGTFSLGLSTNVLPQAMAMGYIHSGTIAGKLNGVMPTQTPSGWRMASQSMPRAMFSSTSPISNDGTPQRELDHLDAALHVAARFDQRLAVLARVAADEVFKVLLQQHLELEREFARVRPAAFPSTPETRRRRLRRPR